MGVLRQRGQRKKVLLACSCPRAAEPLSTFYLLLSRGKVNLDRISPPPSSNNDFQAADPFYI